MTFPTVTHLRSWASARRTARLLHSIQQKYIGCEVVETIPLGEKWAGVIEGMQWDSTLGIKGGWLMYVKYDGMGFGSWTNPEVLELTGVKRS